MLDTNQGFKERSHACYRKIETWLLVCMYIKARQTCDQIVKEHKDLYTSVHDAHVSAF